jgi:hypothetical protein
MPKHKKNPELGNKTTSYSPELYLEFTDAKDLEVGEEVCPQTKHHFSVALTQIL